MKLDTKILTLTVIFGLQSALNLISGILLLSEGSTYGEYGNAFVQAGIMGYLAYAIYSTRTKWAYWFAVFFVGLAAVRLVAGSGLIMYSGITPSSGEIILMIFTAILVFIPLVLLLNKELRTAYLTKN